MASTRKILTKCEKIVSRYKQSRLVTQATLFSFRYKIHLLFISANSNHMFIVTA